MHSDLVAFAHDPWIGGRFAEQPARVLVVGESHYMAESGRELTHDMIRAYIAGERDGKAWNGAFWTNIGQVLTGKHHSQFDRADVWDRIAFFNLVEEIQSGPQHCPSRDGWQQGRHSFLSRVAWVAKEVGASPTHVLVVGFRTWSHLPQFCRPGSIYKDPKGRPIRSGCYHAGDGLAHAMVIRHTSQGFAATAWGDIVAAFMPQVRLSMVEAL